MPSSKSPASGPVGAPLVQVTDAELARYATLVYRRTGIRIPPRKKMLLSNRLRRRLRETGIESFAKYYSCLANLPADHPEWDAFLQEITTHETYLFRDENQWQWFQGAYLPHLAAAAREGRRPRALRIWSAACSTGDEAHTIACCIAANLPNYRQWKIEILGTDIGVDAVGAAQAGIFRERAMRLVPDGYRTRFFEVLASGDAWRAKPVLKELMTFRQHNLLEPMKDRPFDLVFLKNVLIYFDRDSKRHALSHVRAALRPGGLLVAGPADGINEFVRDYVRHEAWLYQRPENG